MSSLISKALNAPRTWAWQSAKLRERSYETRTMGVTWFVPTLRTTTAQCLQDAEPFLSRFQIWRMRTFLWLYAITRRPVQRAFEAQTSVARGTARHEGIARLYLGCRQSLRLANHFPLLLATPTHNAASFAERAAGVVLSLARLVQASSKYASLLSTTRHPGQHCDQLTPAVGATHFALLRRGVVFVVALADAVNYGSLKQMMDELIAYDPPACDPHATDHNAPQAMGLGEFSALPRETWRGLQAELLCVPGLAGALKALHDSAFVVCLDDEVRPCGIQALGRALRLENIHNRYLDKSVQCIVFGNAQAGLLCDHGAMDGVDAIHLAEAISQGLQPSECAEEKATENTAHDAGHTPIAWRVVDYIIPAGLLAKIQSASKPNALQGNRKSVCAEWTEFDRAYFHCKSHPADSVIQLAIALSFFRCTGKHPSVFEPVSLAHLQGGRLDFISPVSGHSRDFVHAIAANASRGQLRTHLAAAVAVQRTRISRAKHGLGHIAHLLALAALEVPHNRARGVARQKIQETIVSTLDSGMALLAHRDIVASSGGTSAAVRLFGTVIHQDNMIGVGYMNGLNALVVDIQASGRYAPMAEKFSQELRRAIDEIGSLAEQTS